MNKISMIGHEHEHINADGKFNSVRLEERVCPWGSVAQPEAERVLLRAQIGNVGVGPSL